MKEQVESVATHTPGPWRHEVGVVYGPNDDGTGFAVDNPSDAPLIAAAPDLLAALIHIRDYARDSRTGRMLTGEGYALADAAIAKALNTEGR